MLALDSRLFLPVFLSKAPDFSLGVAPGAELLAISIWSHSCGTGPRNAAYSFPGARLKCPEGRRCCCCWSWSSEIGDCYLKNSITKFITNYYFTE